MDQEAFEALWGQQQEFQFTYSEERENFCDGARHFATWAERLYHEELAAPTHIGISQKMLLLTIKFFEWRVALPERHRDQWGKRLSKRNHVCIFQIFERVFYQLKVLELSLTPPMLFLPPPPPPPPTKVTKVYKFDSFPIGEVEEDEDEE